LLHYAISSALAQRFDDYEVVVSDNFSRDDTAGVVEAMASRRIRYVRTDRILSMPASWEFGLSHARGEYVTFLCDDDALCPGLLPRVAEVLNDGRARVVGWLGGTYVDETFVLSEMRKKLLLPTFTREVFEYRSEPRLAELFRLKGYGFPMLVNSVCNRDLIMPIRARASRFFLGPSPDYATAAAILSQIDSYLYLDEVLSLGGATSQSIGMTAHHTQSEALGQYIAEFAEGELLRHVPLRTLTPMNNIADTLLQVREALGGRLLAYELDWAQYFVACYRDLSRYQQSGADMQKELKQFFAVLDRQPARIRQRVRAAIAAVEPKRVHAPIVIDCERAGLRDILDCARFVETVPMNRKGRVKKAVVRLFGQRFGLRLIDLLRAAARLTV